MEPQPTPSAPQSMPFSEIETWQLMGLSPEQQLQRAAELVRYHQQRLAYFQQLQAELEKGGHYAAV